MHYLSLVSLNLFWLPWFRHVKDQEDGWVFSEKKLMNAVEKLQRLMLDSYKTSTTLYMGMLGCERDLMRRDKGKIGMLL